MADQGKQQKKNKNAASKAALNIGKDKKYIRTLRILAFLIPVIAVFLGLLAGSFAPFGGKDVMTSGGMTEHLTYYYELYDRVHSGKSLVHSLTSGSGYDFTSVFTYYLSDPINLIILIFPRTAIPAVLNLLYALKIGLAGLFFSMFLTRRKARIEARRASMEAERRDVIREIADRKAAKKELAREKAKARGAREKKDFKLGGSEAPKTTLGTFLSLIDLPNLGFSVAFALSAFMLGQGLDVSHLSAVALFPLILMALDSLLEEGKWRLYAALMTASIFCSFYMTILIFIFSLLYVALFDHKDVKSALRALLLKLISDLLAVGAGALIVFNCLGSTFMQSDLSIKFPGGAASTTFFDVFKAFFPMTAPSGVNFYGFGIDIFCGILAVFLLVLYLGNPNIRLRRKLGQAGILTALTLGLFLVTPNYLFNGFFFSHANVCFFGFLFVVQLISMAYEALLNIDHTPVWQITADVILLGILIVLTPKLCDNYDSIQPIVYALEALAIYFILIVMYRCNSMTKRLLMTLLPVVLIIEVSLSYVDGLRAVGSASTKYEETLESQYYEATRVIHDVNPIARVYYFDPNRSDSTPVTNMLLGYDFVITKTRGGVQRIDNTLEKVTEYGSLTIFKNPYSLHGFYLPSAINDWKYDPNYPFYSQDSIVSRVLGMEPVFENVTGDLQTLTSPLYDNNGTEDPRRTDYLIVFKPEKGGDLYSSMFNIVHLGEKEAGDTASFTHTVQNREVTSSTLAATYALFNEENYIKFYDLMASLVTASNATETSASVSVIAPEDGYIVMQDTLQAGWKVEVSGVSADGSAISSGYVPVVKELLGGQMMVSVPAGQATVTITYTPVWFYIGLTVSLLFLAILVLLSVKDKVRIPEGKLISSMADWLRENYVYVITFAILTLVFILAQMYTQSLPFGDKTTVAGDGYDQTFNTFSGIADSMKKGNYSILNWNLGFSIDRYNSFISHLMTPWVYLRNLLMPRSLYLLTFTTAYFISYVLPGLSLILYLTHRRRGMTMSKKDPRLIVLGTMYGLSTYALAFFMYENFTFLYFVPLMILGLERLVYDKKPALYILLLFIQMGDAYYAFIISEFLLLYFFLMEFDSVKDFFQKGIRFALCSVAAAGLACFRLIPYYLKTTESPYKMADTISPVTRTGGSYLSVFADGMSFRDPVIVTDNDFSVNMYLGILALACIPLFLLNRRVKLSVRIRRVILMGIYFLAFGSSFLNYIFHGFHYQVKVPNRFAAFFLFLLMVSFYDVIQSWKDLSSKRFALSLGIPLAACSALWCVSYSQGYATDLSLTMTLIFAGTYLVLCIGQLRKKYRDQIRAAILAICMIEVIVSGFYTFNQSIGGRITMTSGDNINELAARHPDIKEPFTATEYISSKAYNISESTDITSITAFSSNMSLQHMQLFWKWNLLTTNNSLLYTSGNPLADMMLHVKYNMSNDYLDSSWSHYPIVDRYDNINLHENPNFLPLGIWMPETPKLDAWNNMAPNAAEGRTLPFDGNMFEYQNAFSHAMGCGDLYTEIEPEMDASKLDGPDKDNYSFIQADSSQLEAGLSNEVPVWVSVAKDVEGDVYISYNNAIFYIGTTFAGEADTFQVTMFTETPDYYIRIATVNEDAFKSLHDKLANNTLKDISTGLTSIRGTITAPENGLLYLSLPNMKGWTYTVDGATVEAREYSGGVWLPITAGEHEIRITYTPRGMWLGIGMSGCTLLILIAVYFIRRKQRKM